MDVMALIKKHKKYGGYEKMFYCSPLHSHIYKRECNEIQKEGRKGCLLEKCEILKKTTNRKKRRFKERRFKNKSH